MKYYPIYLKLENKPCVVIGGGKVAERKVVSLIGAGARVTVVSPEVTSEIDRFARDGRIVLIKRPYVEGDLKGALLAYAATNDEGINQAILSEAGIRRVLLNVADDPGRCDFIVPSLVERGDLSIAVSTGGASPAFAKRLRMELEEKYGEECAVFLEIMATIRRKLLTKVIENGKNKSIFNKLANSVIPELIKAGKWDEINETIVSHLGEEFSLASLGMKKG